MTLEMTPTRSNDCGGYWRKVIHASTLRFTRRAGGDSGAQGARPGRRRPRPSLRPCRCRDRGSGCLRSHGEGSDHGGEAGEVADRWFFETVVRLHRAGEGAHFTGLKPAGRDVGPVIPAAERALGSGSPAELADMLCTEVRDQVESRLAHAMALRKHADGGVPQARAWVEAMLGLQVWSHHRHKQIVGASRAPARLRSRRASRARHRCTAASNRTPESDNSSLSGPLSPRQRAVHF
jgi:hypothetical protein